MTIFQTARWFVDQNGGAISSIKLQKLCYYTQAWSYALRDIPFFEGDFEAWVHGPVNRPLWSYFRDIAYRDITPEDFPAGSEPNPTEEEADHLELIWNTYGDWSGYQLEMQSHMERPWLEKREGLSTYEASNRVINPESMKIYYRGLCAQDGII